jgi:uncharacterized protein DUF4242
MPVYRIERHLGVATEDEIAAAAFRGVVCLRHFSNLTWIRSYFDPGAAHFTCYYEAESPEQIRKHAEMAGLPCDSITEVIEYLPDQYR